jgi:hypothetical protein
MLALMLQVFHVERISTQAGHSFHAIDINAVLIIGMMPA